MPTVSVIIPTHARDDLLAEAVDSARGQSHAPLEIIVSDNVPSKDTEAVVGALDQHSPMPVRYLGHHEGGRGCISRNLAAQIAQGDVLAFLDDDDMWEPAYLERMLAAKETAGAAAAYGWLTFVFPDRSVPGKKVPPGLTPEDFILSNPGTVISNLVVDREVFLELGGFDESVHPPYDKDFAIRLLRSGRDYAVLPEHLVLFRQHEGPRESLPGPGFAAGQWAFFAKHRHWMPGRLRLRMRLKCLGSAAGPGFPPTARLAGTLARMAQAGIDLYERGLARMARTARKEA